jgi:hypothetical protein
VSRASQQPVYSVTGVRRGTSDDLAQRQRRYLISMSIRTVSFVLAVVTHGPVRWIFVAAALILPYIAVVMANAVGSRTEESPTPYVPEQSALKSGQRAAINHPPYGAPTGRDDQRGSGREPNDPPAAAAS